MVGGWSPVAPNGESVERNSNFAAQQVNMRVNSFQHKKLINIHSAEAQVVAGVKYRLVFDIATTTCRKNSNEDPATCNEFNKEIVSTKTPLSRCNQICFLHYDHPNHFFFVLIYLQPVERCTAVVWERSWLNERDMLEFTCDRYLTHEEYFSEEHQAKEKAFKESAITAANNP